MKTRILIGTGVLAAFLGGALFGGVARSALSNAFAAEQAVAEQERPVVQRRAAPASRRAVYAEPEYRPEYREVRAEPRVRRRSAENQVLIVAGSSGAGAAIGGLAGGGKGAAIGAIAGAVGGLIYNEHTKEKRVR